MHLICWTNDHFIKKHWNFDEIFDFRGCGFSKFSKISIFGLLTIVSCTVFCEDFHCGNEELIRRSKWWFMSKLHFLENFRFFLIEKSIYCTCMLTADPPPRACKTVPTCITSGAPPPSKQRGAPSYYRSPRVWKAAGNNIDIPAAHACEMLRASGRFSRSPRSVSYTHLTLPTSG